MARKRLNKNVVAILSLLGFAAMVTAAVLMLYQLRHSDPQQLLDLGDQYRKEGQWQQAVVFYGRAFERSRDPRHLVLVGDMYVELGDVPRALATWRNALVYDPNLMEAHRRRVELLLEFARLYGRSQDWKELHDTAEALLKQELKAEEVAFAHNANGLALLNLASENASYVDQGLVELKKAAAMAPENVQYQLDLAIYLVRHDKEEEGRKMLVDLTTRYTTPGSEASKVRLTHAQYLLSRRKTEEAGTLFEEAVNLAGQDKEALQDARTSLAAFLTQQWARLVRDPARAGEAIGVFERVEGIMRQAIDANPDSFGPYLQLALLYQAADRPEDALRVCRARIERPLSRKGVTGARNAYNMFMLMIRASECCVTLGAAAGDRNEIKARDEYFRQAQQLVDDARGELPAHPRASTQTARIRLAQGNYRAALNELRSADDTYASYGWIDWENKKLLARVHLELNEPGAARDVLERVLPTAVSQAADDAGFWTLYAQVLFRTEDLDKAMAFADRVLVSDPNNADAQRIRQAILDRKGESPYAGHPSASPASRALIEARQHLLSNDTEQALQVLADALRNEPADVQLVATTARLLMDTDRSEQALAVLDRATAVKPDDATFSKLRVLARKDLSAEERDRAILELIDAEPDAYKRALERIAYYTGREEHEKALASMNEAEKHLVARDTPLSQVNTLSQFRALLMAKLRTAAQLKHEAAMVEARESGRRHDVDGAGGKSILGAYHMARDEADLAIKALRDAVAAQPTDARSLTLLAQALHGSGAFDEALAFYERAIRANPSEGLAHKGLAMIAKARGDTQTYEQHLARAELLAPGDPWVHAEVLARGELADPRSAIARREQWRKDNPDDLSNVFRLATLYETVREFDRADECYEVIRAARPDDKEVVSALSKYYRRTDRPEKSLEIASAFAQRQTTAEAKAEAGILIASHWLSEGDLERCEQALLEAAKTAETLDVAQSLAEFYFRPANRPREALPWFEKAVNIARQRKSANLDNLLAARISCLLHRSVNELEAARKEIEVFMREYPDDPRGLLLLSESHVRAGELDRAIERLSDYLAKSPNDATILFQRAQHHIAQGRMKLAVADLEQIKRVSPLALRYEPRIQLARLYARLGRRDLCVREVEQLVEETDHAPRAVEELAETYIRENRLHDADRVVTAQINRGGHAEARWFFLRGRISMLLRDYDKALTDYLRGAELTQHDAEAVVRVLDAYARSERFTEGSAYYDSHARSDTKTAAILSRNAVLLARTGREGPAVEQYRQAMELARNDSSDAVRDVTDQIILGFPDRLPQAIELFSTTPFDGSLGRSNDRILTRLYRLTGRTEDASALLDRLIATAETDTERAALWYEKGEMYQLARQAQKAKEGYEQALKYEPDNWITLNNLAYLLSDEMGQNKQALPYAQQAVALADNPATIDELHAALDTLGWIYVGLKEYSLAIAELGRAVRLRPDQALTYYHLGEAYRRNQQFEQAAEMLEAGRRMAVNLNDKALLDDIDRAIQKNTRRESSP